MASTPLLGLSLPADGTTNWGTLVNTSITSLIDSAVAGTTTLSSDADVTLTATNDAANQARQAVLLCTGSRAALRTITAPAQSKTYVVINATTGGFGVKIAGTGPTTGVTVANGKAFMVAWNGSDFVTIGVTTVNLASDVTGTLPVANGGTGQTTYTDGQLLIGNSTGNTLTKATLTAGSGVTITNGSGSINISATGSGGTVTGVTGTSPVVSSGGAAPAISLAAGYGDTLNPYASKTANSVLAAPSGSAGVPSFRALVAADIPTLNQNTSGTAGGLSSTLVVGSGGTGQTTYTDGQLLIGNSTGSTLTKATLSTSGTGLTVTNGSGSITLQNTAPDQTVALTGAGGTTISGTYPNFTITSTNTTYSTATDTTNGLIKLGSGTVQTTAANTVTSDASRTYALQLNSSGQAVVNVPWTGGSGGSVTGVTATSPVASSGGTAPVISLNAGYGDTLNPYASKTASHFLAAPNGTAGVPSFRAIAASDIPVLNQNTTGTAAGLSGSQTANTVYAAPNGSAGTASFRSLVAADVPALSYVSTIGATSPITSSGGLTPTIGVTSSALTKTDDTNVTLTLGGSPTTSLLAATSITVGWAGQLAVGRGGTGTTTAQGAMNTFAGAVTSGQYLRGNGTNVVMATIQAGDVPTLNQNTSGTAAGLSVTLVVGSGGTGATSFTSGALLKGNGSSAIQVASAADIVGQIGSTAVTNATNATNATTAATVSTTVSSGATGTTQAAGDNTTKIATTAFVQTAIGSTGATGTRGQAFTSNGTFTIPTGVTAVKIIVVGGGGGGGSGGVSGCGFNSGSGGGGAGTAQSFLTGLTPGNTLSVTVGAAGAASASGGNSTVASGTQTISTITGGGGSAGGFGNTGGAGGTATGGTINSGGGAGDSSAFLAGDYPTGGTGGSSRYGGGGAGGFGGAGSAGSLYGGGGGGGYGNSNSGAAGAAGVVIFEW